ncbi:7055_t:CDS:2 [Paraglomus occultum]|uniref:7055_t:CDS:1 n=1 Tax=Paraglomus occultum TaxID=144539 RepID=A0A9N8ZNC9_9GLOM|nr:7055_t:CDS:2 [Paraglomus occultum]
MPDQIILSTLRLNHTFPSPALKSKWRDRITPAELISLNLTPKEITRQELINELIVTEADYLADLKFVHRVSKKCNEKIKSWEWLGMVAWHVEQLEFTSNSRDRSFCKQALQKGIRPCEQLVRLFSNIEDMIRLHDNILMCLQSRQMKQQPCITAVSDVLLPFVDRFDIYESYLVNYTTATQQLEKAVNEESEYGNFVKQQEQLPICRKLPLQAFLIAPVQRLAKYPLLFKSLLDATPQLSSDFCPTHKLYKGMDAFIRKIEDAKRKEESHGRVIELQSLIKIPLSFNLLKPGRELINEGYLCGVIIPESPGAYSPEQNAEPQKIRLYVFLFSDIVLWTREKNGQYKLIIPPARITNVSENSDGLFEVTSVHTGKTTFLLSAPNVKDKTVWIKSLRSVLRRHTNRGNDERLDEWWFYSG